MSERPAIPAGCHSGGDEIRQSRPERQPPFRLVVFDFDGTLADSYGWLVGALNRLAPRYGFRSVSAAEEPVLRRLGAADIFRRLRLPAWKRPLVARALRRLMSEEIDQIGLFPGISEMLAELTEAQVPLAVASSNGLDNIARVLGPDRLRGFMHLECGISLMGKRVRLRALRRRYRLAHGELLYIGDEVRDLHAARGAGVAASVVSWGYNHPDALHALNPDYLFSTPDDILSLLLGV